MRNELPDPSDETARDHLAWLEYKAQFHDYSVSASRARVLYQASQALIIVAAALITLSAALTRQAWIAASLGALITVLGGAQQLWHWQANWVDYRRAAEEMRQHGFAFAAGTRPYDTPEKYELLAEHRRTVALNENSGWAERTAKQLRKA